MMLRSTNSPESIGSRSLTSFSSANVTAPPATGLPAGAADVPPPPPDGCCPPAQAAPRIASAAKSERTRAERMTHPPDRAGLGEDTSAPFSRFRTSADERRSAPLDAGLVSLFHPLPALAADHGRGNERSALAYDLALFDPVGR